MCSENKPFCGEEESVNRYTTQQNKKYCRVTLRECVCLRMQTLRYCRGLTQKQVASSLGINAITYSEYEKGKCCMPYEVFVALAEFYQISLDYLFDTSFIRKKAGD